MIHTDQLIKVTFTMGPISIHQFNSFAKYGLNALRIFQYIRTLQGLKNRDTYKNSSDWVIVDNKNLYNMFGVWYSKKSVILKKLEKANLVEIHNRGVGRSPRVRIVCPTKIIN